MNTKLKVLIVSLIALLLLAAQTPSYAAPAVKEGPYWKYVIEPQDSEVIGSSVAAPLDFHNGLAIIKDNEKYGIINKKGEFVLPATYHYLLNFRLKDDLIAYQPNAFEWGFIDYSGNVVHSGYQWASNYSDGLAVVKTGGKYGAIDKAGNWVVPAEYDSLSRFSDGLSWFEKGSDAGYIDKSGKTVLSLPNSIGYDFHNGLAMIGEKKNGVFHYGVIDKSGKTIVPVQYKSVNYGNNGVLIYGYIWVKDTDGYWHIWDALGKKRNPVKLDWMASYTEGYFKFEQNDKVGFMNEEFKIVIPPQYDQLFTHDFIDGAAVVSKDGDYGVIDKQGNIIVPFDAYPIIQSPSEGLAPAKNWNGRWGYIDKQGKEYKTIPFQYDWTDEFIEGLAVVEIKGKQGVIDKQGKLVIPAIYDRIEGFHNGLSTFKLNGKEGIMNKYGQIIVKPEFDSVDSFYVTNMDYGNIFPVGVNGLFGYIVLDDNAADIKPVVPVTAVYSKSSLYVNGKYVPMDAYNIGGNNYFKLRDLAMALTDTGSRFEVTYDSKLKAIDLIAGNPYTPVGKELTVSAQQTNKKATQTTDKIYLNGELAKLAGYTIDGSNYFKLADLAALLKFELNWDAETKRISLTTS